MTRKGEENIRYVARIISERETGKQENYLQFIDQAWNTILLVEQLGFLNKKRFWGDKNNEPD
jgi:hypothetical protein